MQAKGIPGQLVLRGELTAKLLPDEVGALWQPGNIDLTDIAPSIRHSNAPELKSCQLLKD